MLADEKPEEKSIFRNPFVYTTALIAVAVVYLGFVFFSRWEENREIEERAKAKEREEAARAVEMMGGNRLEIQSFSGSPGILRRGETAQLCYGVANAKTVRIDPPPKEPVWPSYARCVNVAPTKDTTYTLTVEDGKGNSKTEKLTIQVKKDGKR